MKMKTNICSLSHRFNGITESLGSSRNGKTIFYYVHFGAKYTLSPVCLQSFWIVNIYIYPSQRRWMKKKTKNLCMSQYHRKTCFIICDCGKVKLICAIWIDCFFFFLRFNLIIIIIIMSFVLLTFFYEPGISIQLSHGFRFSWKNQHTHTHHHHHRSHNRFYFCWVHV